MKVVSVMLLLLLVCAYAESDFEALLELKKGIATDPSGQVLVSWTSMSLAANGCPQDWYGVVCIDGHVVSITLNDVGLVGNFSFPVLTGLKMLKNLSISNNQLAGTISNVGSIQSLEYLDVSRNLFHGFLPFSFVNLQNLVLLNLSSNNFEGTIPSGLSKLERLKYLDFGSNSYSGDMMSLLSQLGGLAHVDLSNNQFSGSVDLGLGSNNDFVSSIRYFNISHNALVGQLFAHDAVPYFDSLEVFDASYNQLTGDVPPFQLVVSLQILRLGSNRLSGYIPKAFLQDKFMILSELDLSLNQLEGPVRSITSSTLKKLNLSSNKLSGPLPANVGHCAIIDLTNNMLSGDLSRIKNWGNYVEVIQLSDNLLSGSLPNQTSQFLKLTLLKASNNSINGEIPPAISTYSQLQVLDLSFNSLDGSLLPSLFTSTTLTELNLSANNFSGSIPLWKMYNPTKNLSLVSIDLSLNSLDGYLPSEISKLHNLVYLNLSNNKLEGVIPNYLPDGLKAFDVSSNNLSGLVPDNLRRFPDSAFHPGNSWLILPNTPWAPQGAPALTLKEHQSRKKHAIKVFLIAGIIGTATVIAFLCILIYYQICHRQGRGIVKRSDGHEGILQEHSSLCNSSAANTNLDQSSSFSFCQSHHPSLLLGSTFDDRRDIPSPQSELKDHPESMTKDNGLSSPLSFLSSSNPSPSKTRVSFENLDFPQVYSPDKLAGDLHLFDGSLAFTEEELSCASAKLIGRSCHGSLYKATLVSGNVLAVKWLKEGMAKGQKEFAREVKKLGTIKHPNLVSLQGYYWGPKDHEKMILSNYINGHCLSVYLQETEPRKLPPLSIDERLRIALDVARCLNYLHNERAIPHGNLKATNIILEPPNMNTLLTDYSLHRILTSTGTAEQVLNAGALGYMPPEFASSSRPCPSLKSDVYAFGVILMELLTGKCAGEIVSADPGVVDLTERIRLLADENRSDECFDKVLLDEKNVEAPRILGEMLRVALRCTLPASERPDMKSVFEDLSILMP